MNKTIKPSRYLLTFVLVVCAVLFIAFFVYTNRVVATTDGNDIRYNNETYVETFEVFDLKKGKFLGRVDFIAYNSKLKMYSILDKPDYLFLDMGRDYRIYKRVPNHSEDEYIGKTSKEIEKTFGLFDCVGMPADEDGLYRNCQCGYTIKESKKGFLGTTPEILLFITFDENGVAIACEEGYRPGG